MILTDEEIIKAWDDHTIPVFNKTGINPTVFARAIESAVIEKIKAGGPVALLPIGEGIKPSIRSTCGVNCITEREAKEYTPEAVLKLYRIED